MNEFLPSHSPKSAPPRTIAQPHLVPVVLKLKGAYGVWQNYLSHFPKANRFTLGSKIDDVFLATIEYCFLASYSPVAEKMTYVDRAISRIDLVKLLFELSWDIRALDSNKYVHLSEMIAEAGKMLGGWRRQLAQKEKTRVTHGDRAGKS